MQLIQKKDLALKNQRINSCQFVTDEGMSTLKTHMLGGGGGKFQLVKTHSWAPVCLPL